MCIRDSLFTVFRWIEWVSPWSMIEVFLLGVFVAYTRLVAIAHVQVGGAVFALGALMMAMAAADSVLDHEAVWEGLERRGVVAGHAPGHGSGRLAGCDSCGLVSRATPVSYTHLAGARPAGPTGADRLLPHQRRQGPACRGAADTGRRLAGRARLVPRLRATHGLSLIHI